MGIRQSEGANTKAALKGLRSGSEATPTYPAHNSPSQTLMGARSLQDSPLISKYVR
jgi:hypothetical protein